MVPYDLFDCADGQVILAIGNDSQFASFCKAALVDDPRYSDVSQRLLNRGDLIPCVAEIIRTISMAEWFDLLRKANVPCGPVYTVQQAFDDPHIEHRNMQRLLVADDKMRFTIVPNPIQLSKTPVTYRLAPPRLGTATGNVLSSLLHKSQSDIARLRAAGVI